MKKKKWNKILAVFWVIMTAILLLNAFNEDRKKALECGMDGFLSKPIVIEELISALQNNLESFGEKNNVQK